MSEKIIQQNKKAYFDYFIEDKYEAGISLKGSEVKSVKEGKISIKNVGKLVPTFLFILIH